jgi:hypothetical protein
LKRIPFLTISSIIIFFCFLQKNLQQVGLFGFISAFALLWVSQTSGGHGPMKASDDTKIKPQPDKVIEVTGEVVAY